MIYMTKFQTASMSEALEARRREVMAGQEAWRSGGRDAPTGESWREGLKLCQHV